MIVVSRTVLFFIVFVASFSFTLSQVKYHSVTILLSKDFTVKDAAELGVELDHGATISEQSLSCVVNDYVLDSLKKLPVLVEIEKYDLAKFYAQSIAEEKRANSIFTIQNSKKLYGSMGNFLTLEEIYDIFFDLIQQYPDYIKEEQIGTTFENRPIYAFHIGEDAVKNSTVLPRTLITSLHHAREAVTATITSFFVQDFFEKVENNDPFCLYVLKHSPITIIPCLNPDGYEYNRITNPSGGGMWRKNRRKLTNSTAFGVDPNRNYGPKEFWNSINGGSATIGNSDTYRGDSAFSEAETQAIRYLHETYTIKTAINFHSFSNLIVTPISYNSMYPPDEKTYHYFCTHHTESTRYPFGRDVQMVNYPARGSSDDYLYLGTQKKAIAMTPEVGSVSDGFWPVLSKIFPLVQSNLPSIYNGIRSTIAIPYMYSYASQITNNDTLEFSFQFTNTSLQPTKPCKLIFSKYQSISQSQLLNSTDSLDTLAIGSSITKKIYLANLSSLQPAENSNGIIIEQQFDGFSILDTVYYSVHKRREYGLYNGEYMLSSVILKGWEIEYDDSDSTYSLTESVNSNTPQSSSLTTQSMNEISLEGCIDAYIEFDAKWDFEANNDGAIVFFQESGSNTINPLSCERTINFSNNSSNLFLPTTPTMNGRFSQRIVQRASLNRFLGKKGKVGFQVRTNSGVTYDGFNLYSAKIVTHSNESTNLIESKNQQLLIRDSYNTLSFSIIQEQKPFNPLIDFKIYSINGALVYSNEYEWGSQNYLDVGLFKNVFPSGAYIVSVNIDGKTIQEPFTVVR